MAPACRLSRCPGRGGYSGRTNPLADAIAHRVGNGVVHSELEVWSVPTAAVGSLIAAVTSPLYDLWFILRERHLEHPEEVITGLNRKLASREGRASDVLVTRLERVEAVLRKSWETRLGVQVDMLPGFEDCFRDVKQLMGAFDRLREAEVPRRCPVF